MAVDRVERRLAAVLAADVAGYSRLMGGDEEGTLARLKAARKAVVDPAIASHRGRIVKTTGDGMLVEFASAVDAARCSVEVQRAMAAKNAGVSQDARIEFRIGIHVGDIIIDDNDIFGDGVNIAARLEGIAEPGGVCISDDAYRQVRGKVEIAWDDLGPQILKNIAGPMQAWRAQLSGQGAVKLPPGSTAGRAPALALPDKPSIAVLPFQNMSGDPDQEYFADGIVEDIITALSRFPSLFVIARNSCFTYKGKAVDVRQVGSELGVRYVLEGSVRKAGGRIRITAQLIEARSNKHLWAEKLDGQVDDLFELQDTLTMKIVSSVSLKLEIAEFERVKAKATVDLDAYDLYQKATALQRYDRRFDEAYELFCKAFAIDPAYAAAYVLAASTLFNRQFARGTPMPPEIRAEIIRLTETGMALPHEDALAMARAAHLLSYLGKQYDVGKELADHALRLNPNLGFAWLARGWISVMRGESELAIDSFTALLRLDPLDPARPQAWSGLGCAYNIVGAYEKGYEWSRKAVEVNPAMHSFAYFVINAVPYGRVAEARDTVAKMLEIDPGTTVSDALVLCHTRDQEWFERMTRSFREAGLPDSSS
ncbi:MAG: adenylate/guanylate cyclase domain-containing protein [bacterium]|nr:adenylate/guanylate cyclase domain-containing protein [bacterium]